MMIQLHRCRLYTFRTFCSNTIASSSLVTRSSLKLTNLFTTIIKIIWKLLQNFSFGFWHWNQWLSKYGSEAFPKTFMLLDNGKTFVIIFTKSSVISTCQRSKPICSWPWDSPWSISYQISPTWQAQHATKSISWCELIFAHDFDFPK